MGSAAGVAVGQPNADDLFLRPGDAVDVRLDGIMTLSTEITEEEW
jgi:2-keto-4-pentenoate hydratase/2-oxohepta-3-ene-1,7-dioic acid hydratase in catechol pathway